MGLFKDHEGREWRIAFSPGVLKRIAESEKCDPNEVMSGPVDFVLAGEASQEDFYGLLWLILKPQLEAKGIDQAGFSEITFDTAGAAYPALREAVVDFTPPLKQGLVRAAFEKTDQTIQKAEKIFRDKLEDDERLGVNESQLNKVMDQAMDQAMAASKASRSANTTSANSSAES